MDAFWISVAGPLTHIPTFAVWFGLFAAVKSPSQFSPFQSFLEDFQTVEGWFGAVFEEAAFLNIVLFALNLLVPAYPLGGGQCLPAVLVKFGKPVRETVKILSMTGMISAFGIIALGVILQLSSGGGVFLMLVGAWLLFEGFRLFRMTKGDQLVDHPLFAQPCYREAAGMQQNVPEAVANREAAAGGNANANVPWAQPNAAGNDQNEHE